MFNDLSDKFPPYELRKVSEERLNANRTAIFRLIERESDMKRNSYNEFDRKFGVNAEPQTVYIEKRSPLKTVIPIAAAAAVIAFTVPFGVKYFGGRNAVINAGSSAGSSNAVISAITPAQSGDNRNDAKPLPAAEIIYTDTKYDYKPYTTDNAETENIEKHIINYLGMSVDWESGFVDKYSGYNVCANNDGTISESRGSNYHSEKVRSEYVSSFFDSEYLFLCSTKEALNETLLLFDRRTGEWYKLKNDAEGIGRALIFEYGALFIYEYEIIPEEDIRLIRYIGKYELTKDCFRPYTEPFKTAVPSPAEAAMMTEDELTDALKGVAIKELDTAWGDPDGSLTSGVYGSVWRKDGVHILIHFDANGCVDAVGLIKENSLPDTINNLHGRNHL